MESYDHIIVGADASVMPVIPTPTRTPPSWPSPNAPPTCSPAAEYQQEPARAAPMRRSWAVAPPSANSPCLAATK